MQDLEIVQEIARVMDNKKATDIVALDVSKMTVVCNYMIICTGRSTLLVSAIVREIQEKMDALGVRLHRSEGVNEGRWAILDYGHTLVHVFHPEERAYYNLERLWEDGENRVTLELE